MEWSAPFKPLSSSSIRFDEAWVKIELVDVWIWRAPCKGGAFQWVKIPPGNRSSRKQSEQSWR